MEYFEKRKNKFLGIYWYYNKPNTSAIEPIHKSLYYCINNCKNDFVIYKSDGFKMQWGIANSIETNKMIEEDNNLYEVLLDRKRKVYFDIDVKNPEDSFLDHLEKCKTAIDKQFPNANFQISGSETKEKYSYHIILSNYYADNLDGSYVLYAFSNIYNYLGFDKSVYSKNRNMKCINQSKGSIKITVNGKQQNKKDTRVQARIEGSYLDNLVGYFDKFKACYFDKLVFIYLTYVNMQILFFFFFSLFVCFLIFYFFYIVFSMF